MANPKFKWSDSMAQRSKATKTVRVWDRYASQTIWAVRVREDAHYGQHPAIIRASALLLHLCF